ncbi:MAG TPA: autotransporter-associated beta strand repeat-containing protein [Verrucomicrobiae bacterium]|jgi:autotransporter-associated beta strand protein|nr:autotransporter-associated beta strand repeat-containing protein [Verrucomicrobiae bacterium]
MKNTICRVPVSNFLAGLPIIAACLLVPRDVRAANDYWSGADSANSINWSDAANWTFSGQSSAQTYYNEVEFLGPGGNPNNVFTVNSILDSTGGVSQMPVWQLDFNPTNVNYTLLINPGITLNVNAGNGTVDVGADYNHQGSPATPNAVETITIQGPGAELSMINTLTVCQGSSQGGDTHMVTLDMSGLDNFVNNGPSGGQNSSINVAPAGNFKNSHGILYLAKTNSITLGNQFYVCNQNTGSSNSVACAAYLGIANNILVGSGNLLIGGPGTSAAGAFMKFNPAFVGGTPTPAAYFGSTNTSGRIANFLICNENGGSEISGNAYADFTGGNIQLYASTMQIGQGGSTGANGQGTLTFDNGAIDVNTAIVGNQNASAGGTGWGEININTNTSLGASGSLKVNTLLTLGAVSGTLTSGTAGIININGGALSAGSISNGLGAGAINVSNGSVTITGNAGSLAAPINYVGLTNSTLAFSITLGSTNAYIASLATSGSNKINIVSVPPLSSLPAVVELVKYTTLTGAGFNFGLGTLPPLSGGYISNDTANSAIDLVLTNGPLSLTWTGDASDLWDYTSINWSSGAPETYADGDTVVFPDGAHTGTVSLQDAFSPGDTTVNNSSLPYTFDGSGSIGGSGSLTKEGSATLLVDNSGVNTYTGGTTISGGTVQIGTNDANGNLAGAIDNNGALVYDRNDGQLTVANAISGSGSLTYEGGGILQLSGNNSFTGPISVIDDSTLQAGSSLALGGGSSPATIANGSTVDADGNSLTKPIVISGTGVNGEGALIDSGGAVYDSGGGLAPSITLAGNTTISIGPQRADLGVSTGTIPLSTSGQPYDLVLNSTTGYFEWRGVVADAALANIDLTGSGTWGLVGATTLGNPTNTLTLEPGTALTFYNANGVNVTLNKAIIFNGGATIGNGGGATVLEGSMTLVPSSSPYCTVGAGGTSLTLSNTLSGSGILYVQNDSSPLYLAGDSPAFTGGVLQYTGLVDLSGDIGSGVTNLQGTLFDGTGTSAGLADISGGIVGGGPGVAGTLTVGGLILEPGALITNNLNSAVTVGGGVNSLIVVNGDITPNGSPIYINPLAPLASGSTYTLLTYTGNLNGSFGAPTIVGGGSTYTLVLTNVTTTSPKKIELIVTGGAASALLWDNAGGNGEWDVELSPNWSNLTTHVASDYFSTFDSVTFDDSIITAANPQTAIDIAGGQVVIPSVMTNNSTTNYTISGSGKISGSANIVKLGTSTLTMSTVNDFSGTTTIAGGTLKANNGSLGGPTANIVVTNGATLDLNYEFGSQPLFLSGAGVGGIGALVDNDPSGNSQYDSDNTGLANITLTGNTTIGGSNRLDFGQNSPGSGTLSTRGSNYNITIVGYSGYREWDNLALDSNFGNIYVMPVNGTLGIKGATTLGNPTNIVSVSSNATLILYTDATAPILNKTMLIYGGGQFTSESTTYDLAPIILGISAGDNCTFNIGGSIAISNVISGPGNLVESGGGSALILTAANTYTGSTVIDSGPLRLVGGGSISASATINIASGQVLDVSGRSDQTLTLVSGQTLEGSGTVDGSLVVGGSATVSPAGAGTIGTLTATNEVTLEGNAAMEVNKTAKTSDQLTGATIVYGGTLSVTNLAGTLAAGDSFTLFNAGTYSGAFSGIAPNIPGPGLVWNTSQLNVSGTLSVTTGSAPPPSFIAPTYSSGNVVLSGTGGTPGQTYYILSTTNLASTNWVVIDTNTFTSGGDFGFTNAVSPSTPGEFYKLETQ